MASEDGELSAQLKSWFTMESYATRVDVSGRSKEDKRALAQLEQTTKLVDGRYEVGLPWAEDNPKIENNYFSAHSQFCSLERRLGKDLSLKARYQETIKVDLRMNMSGNWMKKNLEKRRMRLRGMCLTIQ